MNAVMERPEVQSRTDAPVTTPPATETPTQKRERLRQEVRQLGGDLALIESIDGDCPLQTSQQIGDLTAWLSGSPQMHQNLTR